MAEKVRNIAPYINDIFYVTSEYGWRTSPITGELEFHKGIDIATPSADGKLYSIVDGTVLESRFSTGGFGNMVVIKNNSPIGEAFLYAHMKDASPLSAGDTVQKGDFVGIEGATGYVTGVHLHLEQQNLGLGTSWNYTADPSQTINPAIYMGIDNIEGTSWIYDGTPVPPTPTYKKNSNFKFVLFDRNKRIN